MGYADYLNRFEEVAIRYIPRRGEWTPADEAVYGPPDPYRVPKEESDRLRINAIRYQLTRHFEHNRMYHDFCVESKFQPDMVKGLDDLDKVPLIPSEFFKDCPTGKDFALWLANLYTGDVPQVRISGRSPSQDHVIEAFNASGMAVTYSSGTGGRHTFMPRDMRSFFVNEYAMAKGVIAMFYPHWNPQMHGYLLLPNPFKTNLFAGRLGTIFFDIMKDVSCAIDREVDTELIKMSMSDDRGLKTKAFKYVARRRYEKTISDIISWIERNQREGNEMAFVGAPYLLHSVIAELKEQGRTFDIGDRGCILTGGGWKVHEHKRIPEAEFRKDAQNVLGIGPDHCIDLYGMVEGNGWMTQCPEGHYLHIPMSYLHPMVLDDEYRPVGYGEVGRFAFLDGSMGSYPGFIITNDRVRMLERCPVCDRPGAVLEPGVSRVAGKESRGCADEVRRMISSDMRG
jgi:hypothetical protein